MRAEPISPPPMMRGVILLVAGISWHPYQRSKGRAHQIARGELPGFWQNWGKARTFELTAFVKTQEELALVSYLEACARHQIEGYTGRTAALTASCRLELEGEDIRFWTYVIHPDVPENRRAYCEASLYGKLELQPL